MNGGIPGGEIVGGINSGRDPIRDLVDRVRDLSNNLKLYRADILRNLHIESPHFSANLETGLKPLLAG